MDSEDDQAFLASSSRPRRPPDPSSTSKRRLEGWESPRAAAAPVTSAQVEDMAHHTAAPHEEGLSEHKLVEAMHYNVYHMCHDKRRSLLEVRRIETDETGMTPQVENLTLPVNRAVVAVVAEMAFSFSQRLAQDLEMFAAHAKRKTISPDDVLLVARRNKSLRLHLAEAMEVDDVDPVEALGKKKAQGPKSSKKAKPAPGGDDGSAPPEDEEQPI